MNVLRVSSSGGGASNWRSDPELACGGIMIDHGWHNLYLIFGMIRESLFRFGPDGTSLRRRSQESRRPWM